MSLIIGEWLLRRNWFLALILDDDFAAILRERWWIIRPGIDLDWRIVFWLFTIQ